MVPERAFEIPKNGRGSSPRADWEELGKTVARIVRQAGVDSGSLRLLADQEIVFQRDGESDRSLDALPREA